MNPNEKNPETIAAEIKSHYEAKVKEVEAKNAADMQVLQKEIDDVKSEMKRAKADVNTNKVNTIVDVIEAKSELKNYARGDKKVEFKASVDMLRANSIGASQSLIASGATIQKPNQINHVRDFMRVGKLSSPVYTFDREVSMEGTPALVAEGALKPKISFVNEQVVANAVKIASHFKMSTELVHDAPAFAYRLEGRGIEATLKVEDYNILYGTGTAGNLEGLMTKATPFNAGAMRVPYAQSIDVIRVASLQVELSDLSANVALVHPADLALMELTKDQEGRYILPAMLSGTNATTVAGIRVVAISSIVQGEFLVGSLDLAVETFSVEDLHVDVSDSNENDFITNKVTVRIEERLIQAVVRPLALVKGTFADAKAQLGAA